MRRILLAILFCFALLSCSKDPVPVVPVDKEVEKTLIFYFAWSTNLDSYYSTNLADIQRALGRDIQGDERVIICYANSPSELEIYELKLQYSKVSKLTLETLEDKNFTTQEDLTELFKTVKELAPARTYSLMIGSHGMGWIPVAETQRGPSYVTYMDNPGLPMTRYFGGGTADVQTEISTLAEALEKSDMDLEYILFDNCYMSNIELVYTLKDVTDYIIACPTEIMAYGFPYEVILESMLGSTNYYSLVSEFMAFYDAYNHPYATIAVMDTKEVDALVPIVKQINQKYGQMNPSLLSQVQLMDGYTPTIFYDLGDYITKLCLDPQLLEQFNAQLTKLVKIKANTSHYPTAIGGFRTLPINAYSGLTISDPSTHDAVSGTKSSWYEATH